MSGNQFLIHLSFTLEYKVKLLVLTIFNAHDGRDVHCHARHYGCADAVPYLMFYFVWCYWLGIGIMI